MQKTNMSSLSLDVDGYVEGLFVFFFVFFVFLLLQALPYMHIKFPFFR